RTAPMACAVKDEVSGTYETTSYRFCLRARACRPGCSRSRRNHRREGAALRRLSRRGRSPARAILPRADHLGTESRLPELSAARLQIRRAPKRGHVADRAGAAARGSDGARAILFEDAVAEAARAAGPAGGR